MKTNVYDINATTLLVVGSCLEKMQPNAFNALKKQSSEIFEVCLEETHVNMALSKLLSITARNNIQKIIFASVDKSMHCTQLHYIESEMAKIIDLSKIQIVHYVSVDDKLIEISSETIKLSKNLSKLKELKNL